MYPIKCHKWPHPLKKKILYIYYKAIPWKLKEKQPYTTHTCLEIYKLHHVLKNSLYSLTAFLNKYLNASPSFTIKSRINTNLFTLSAHQRSRKHALFITDCTAKLYLAPVHNRTNSNLHFTKVNWGDKPISKCFYL